MQSAKAWKPNATLMKIKVQSLNVKEDNNDIDETDNTDKREDKDE